MRGGRGTASAQRPIGGGWGKQGEKEEMQWKRENNKIVTTPSPCSRYTPNRCHARDGGSKQVCCVNDAPDKLYNQFDFEEHIVNEAFSVMHKWFVDKELGVCRVTDFSGWQNSKGTIEPMLFYKYMVKETGTFKEEFSTVVEVAEWVRKCDSNV